MSDDGGLGWVYEGDLGPEVGAHMTSDQTPTPPRFQVFVGIHTDVGRQRQKNEDSLLECGVPLGYLLAVADGMGGYEYG
ncbi:MAG TPA: hypothetical protein PLI95_11190, partial [Polyangiaceae bacterium]|nr:hypothetical protein [Polyangiaceae bacterium]